MEKVIESTLFLRKPVSTIILYLYSLNLSDEELANIISGYCNFTRDEIKLALPFSKNNELREKFRRAFNIIELKRIEEYVKAVNDNMSDEFLFNLSLLDKSSLMTQFILLREQLSCFGINSDQEQQYYLDVIKNAIDKEFEEEAVKQGFSIEEWKKHLLSHKKITVPEPLSTVTVQQEESPIEKVKK